MKLTYLGFAAIAALLIGAWLAGDMSLVTALATGAGVTVFSMILDERTEFCDATSVINAVGTTLVGDVIDLSVARNVGSPPKPLYCVIQVDTTLLASGGASEIAFVIASDAAAAIAVDGTATEHYRSKAFPKATWVAGFTLCIPLPGVQPDYERYLGILEVVTTFAVTTGKINAFLTTDPKQWKAYPDGIA